MRVDDFDFELPEELIALRPAEPRTASRLLIARGAETEFSTFDNIAHYLQPGDLLVLNDTKVLPSRLSGTRHRNDPLGDLVAKIELTLMRDLGDGSWAALAKPARKLKPGDRLHLGAGLEASVMSEPSQGMVKIAFNQTDGALVAALEQSGAMPLPPYIAGKRAPDATDHDSYQTVFAARPGAVAAPTASLHFDAALLDQLRAKGINFTTVTLHVGAGTFLPVKVDNIADHKMHAEWGEVSQGAASAIASARAERRRVIPVGTTALRLIETAARSGTIKPMMGDTDIFISPGFEFQASDGLITNFHLPRSTLLMLVAAFVGYERMKEIYAQAIDQRLRFFSYGDSSLLLPKR